MWHLFLSTLPPLLSITLLVLGIGGLSTLISVQLDAANMEPWVIGLISSNYYLGMVAGSFHNARFITRVGHIRAYATYAAIITITNLLYGLIFNPTLWGILRFISGYCTAGLYIAIESWLLNASDIKTRGQALSLYMIALYAAQALGQFIIKLANHENILLPYVIIAILAIISILPLSIATISSPRIEEPAALSLKELYKKSPSGMLGCFSSGLILSVIYGLLPVIINNYGYSLNDNALIMASTIFGGMLLQYPVGKLSDHIDRRIMLAILSSIMAFIAFGTIYIAQYKIVFIVSMFMIGGCSFTLYPVSINHACDLIEQNNIVSATQSLLLCYGIGCIIGPLITPIVIFFCGDKGLFVYFSIIAIMLAILFSIRIIIKRLPLFGLGKSSFMFMPRTTPSAMELEPRAHQDNNKIH